MLLLIIDSIVNLLGNAAIGIIRRRGKDGEEGEEDEKSSGEAANKREETAETVVVIVAPPLESHGKAYYVRRC